MTYYQDKGQYDLTCRSMPRQYGLQRLPAIIPENFMRVCSDATAAAKVPREIMPRGIPCSAECTARVATFLSTTLPWTVGGPYSVECRVTVGSLWQRPSPGSGRQERWSQKSSIYISMSKQVESIDGTDGTACRILRDSEKSMHKQRQCMLLLHTDHPC